MEGEGGGEGKGGVRIDVGAGVEAARDHFVAVPRVHASTLTPLTFLRRFVAPSKPVILLGAAECWPALQRWQDPAYLLSASGEAAVTLSRTPTGRADAVEGGSFFLPLNQTLPLRAALGALLGGPGSGAACGTPYLSAQDDCLRRELPVLARDIGEVLVAEEALGHAEAKNVWIAPPTAGPRACASPPVSSTHKDHYENLVTVVCGVKTFTLLPPTDAGFLASRRFPVLRYAHADAACRGGGQACPGWSSAPVVGEAGGGGEPATVPWIAVNVDSPDAGEKYPLFRHATPLRVALEKGETLYLPALWYHQVGVGEGQEGLTVSVNSWFDMEFGVPFVAQKLMGGVV